MLLNSGQDEINVLAKADEAPGLLNMTLSDIFRGINFLKRVDAFFLP